MKCSDADAQRWLASVSAMLDEGNVVVFGPREPNFENTGTGQMIPMHRRTGVFVLQLDAQVNPSTVEAAKHDAHKPDERGRPFSGGQREQRDEVRECCKTK